MSIPRENLAVTLQHPRREAMLRRGSNTGLEPKVAQPRAISSNVKIRKFNVANYSHAKGGIVLFYYSV